MPPSRPPPTPTEHESDDSQADSKRGPRLSREQEELRDALAHVGPRLGPIYVGGLRVLEDHSNPDRLAQSAHSMRELMEKMEERFSGPGSDGGGKRPTPLKVKAIEVEQLFRAFFLDRKKRTGTHSHGSRWSGKIDPRLSRALDKLGEFLEWFAEVHPRRRELFERMLTGLDASGLAVSPPLVSSSWERWKKIRDYFNSVSHHRRDASSTTLREHISMLEVFLAHRLHPKTSEDLDEMDSFAEETHDA